MVRRNKSATLRRRTKSFVDERLHFQKMFQMSREIDKYKKSLEKSRPKTNELKCFGKIKPSYSVCSLRSLQSLSPDTTNYTIGDYEKVSSQHFLAGPNERDVEDVNGQQLDGKQYEKLEKNDENNQTHKLLAPIPILLTSEYAANGNYTMDNFGRGEEHQILSPITIPFECDGDEGHGDNHTFQSLSPISTSPPNLNPSESSEIDESKCFESIESKYSPQSIHSSNSDVTSNTFDECEKLPPQHILSSTNEVNRHDDKSQHEGVEANQHEEKEEINHTSTIPISRTIPISSECLIDESYATNGIDINNFMQESHIQTESESVSPCSSTQSELRTVIRQQQQYQQIEDDFEFIITPTIMVNVMDTLRSNLPHQFDCVDHIKPTGFHRESQIAVSQRLSIHVKKQSRESVKGYTDSSADEYTEGNDIINQVLSRKPQENFIQLQRYFLKWVHFTTLEKLKRRNPAQTRLQKMEAFLQNITLERKRALNKLRRPGNIVVPKQNEGGRMMDSPRLLNRTYNNK